VANALQQIAKVRQLQKLKQSVARPVDPKAGPQTLYEFIPTLPKRSAPRHLDPLIRSLEDAWTCEVRQTAHAPPRHAKTDTVLAYIALTLKKFPWLTLAYISYEAKFALSKSRVARQWAIQAGVRIAKGADTQAEWRTPEGGGLIAGGIGGPLTGKGVNILLVDDPYKNRQQAESPAWRSMTQDWWGDVAETRIEPGGSAFVFHTRWNPDDLIHYITTGEDGPNWRPHIKLQAIDDHGRALWPERWPVEALRSKMANPFTWASLYQGDPRPRGGKVFEAAPSFYAQLPPTMRTGLGGDFAYTEKKWSDFSVIVAMARSGDDYYVLDVLRRRGKIEDFVLAAESFRLRYAHSPFVAFIGGQEGGIVGMLNAGVSVIDAETQQPRLSRPLNCTPLHATTDKFQRAQPVSAVWNQGRIHLPETQRELILPDGTREWKPVPGTEWVPEYLDEISSFTGLKDPHDDQVDATAGAFLALQGPEIDARPPPAPRLYNHEAQGIGFG
jgi:phage terminase large subunit-like protein